MSFLSNTIQEPPSSVYEPVFAGGDQIQEDGWPGVNGIIGSSAAIKQILEQVKTVAPLDSTVLIQGETGTGKELIASAIHNLSSRRRNNFVRFNCAAVPAGLLESDLFGHERGAFTGALTRKLGRFEVANKGTLFFDEIGDMPLDLQAKLLRVLQEQEFERLGSTQTQHVNVRVVAATNCDLKTMMAEKQFRNDLYFRLNVFPIRIPPLRERPEDIAQLVKAFVSRFATRMNRRIEVIPDATLEALRHYEWPGNIRELQNFLERSVILSPGPTLQAPLESLSLDGLRRAVVPGAPLTLEEAETRHIIEVLQQVNWVIGGPKGAAEKLGLKRTTLIAKMQRLGITRPELRYGVAPVRTAVRCPTVPDGGSRDLAADRGVQ
ncbi:MAG TPA: sigma 54-interacting transcriptional regulator [Terriglobales bacterium]|nr:sigma 54-interacting transcriptional regulator [Terriglobales bacterium]